LSTNKIITFVCCGFKGSTCIFTIIKISLLKQQLDFWINKQDAYLINSFPSFHEWSVAERVERRWISLTSGRNPRSSIRTSASTCFFHFNLKTKHVDFIHSFACQCHVYYTKYYYATCIKTAARDLVFTWHCQPIKSAEYNQWNPLLRLL
jgi:hypothetical protein